MDNDKIILFDVFGIAFPLALGKKEKSDTEIIFNLFELVSEKIGEQTEFRLKK